MRTDLPMQMDKAYTLDKQRAGKLAKCSIGEGHDNFLNGIIVQFDLTAPVKVWTEAQRYHFLDFVSSQSTMHRLLKMNLEKQFDENVDKRIVKILNELKQDYLVECTMKDTTKKKQEVKFLKFLMSCPVGILLTARMTTNYRQLKTIYRQRRKHRLPHWRLFCHKLKDLPYSDLITS